MIRFAAFLTLGAAALFPASPASAGGAELHEAGPAVAVSEARVAPALWLIKDVDSDIYLFGTIASLPPKVEWRTALIDKALKDSDEIVLEVVDTDPDMVARLVSDTMHFPTGETIQDVLDPEDFEQLQGQLEKTGISAETVEHFKPAFLAITLHSLTLHRDGFTGNEGVEAVLKQEAKLAGKPVAALETIADSFAAFSGMPRDDQVAFLNDTVARVDSIAPNTRASVKAWQAGDVDQIGKLVSESMPKEAWKRIGPDRSRNWAGWIQARLAGAGTSFVAVTAGNLAGEQSLLTFLTERGIEAERIQ